MSSTLQLTDLNLQVTNQVTGQNLQVQSHNHIRNQLYEIVFVNSLSVGFYKLFMKFKTQTSALNGLFKVNYIESYTDR